MRTHPFLAPVLASSLVLAAGALAPAAPHRAIFEIQGRGHLSPFVGEEVATTGCITALADDGYYLQDVGGDGDEATSDAIFVFTGSAPDATLTVGLMIELEAVVAEFTPGGTASGNLSITRLEAPSLQPVILPQPPVKPQPVTLGSGGRLPPTGIIDNDNFLDFDPAEDGLDFFESLEGMLVTLVAPLVVCPSNAAAELYAVADEGSGATGMSKRGTLNLAPDDYNPERIQIQEKRRLDPGMANGPVNVGDLLADVTGVLGYDGMYEILALAPVTMVPGGNVPQSTSLLPYPERLRVASYNVAGLDPAQEDPARTDPTATGSQVDNDIVAGRYDAIAAHLVHHLGAPDIIALQDLFDDDGAELSAETGATRSIVLLLGAILEAGGPSYVPASVDPLQPATLNDNGTPDDAGDDFVEHARGQPAGGNARNLFLYNAARVTLVAGSTVALEDSDLSDGDAFAGAPQPLQATFLFDGEEVRVLNVRLTDRAGSVSVFGTIQPATELQDDPTVNGGVDRRLAQATALRAHTDATLAADPDARIVILGGFNECEFLAPTLAFGNSFTNLTETIANAERYTTIAQGNSLSLDHLFLSKSLLRLSPRFEIVHLNCEFADTVGRGSDRDPLLASLAVRDPLSFAHRAIDGVGNNLLAPAMGAAGQSYLRATAGGLANFHDGLNYPPGSSPERNPDPHLLMHSVLPGARALSNGLSATATPEGVASAARLSSWTWQWGQFIDHDFGLAGGPAPGDAREFFPIPVPVGDPDLDPFRTGAMVIRFTRSAVAAGSGLTTQRETPNLLTAFLDGSALYGSDDLRALNLRSFAGGRLASQPGPDGELPPYNLYGRDNANDLALPAEHLLLAGDLRANEQCALTAAHTLLLREHNRLADEIAARDFAGADLADPAVDAGIYQRARKLVGAIIQHITYDEFLPAVLGPDPLPPYAGYEESLSPSLSQEFAHAAYRVGHTMLPAKLLRFDAQDNPHPAGHLPLRNAFFNPVEVTGLGIDPYLRGLARQVQQEIDRFVIDDVRSFLFGPPGAGGLDLAALNIQRGRDHGLPSLNAVRSSLSLPVASDYHGITSDPAAAAAFEAIYQPGNVDLVDLWIGGISEDHLPGSHLGMTFHALWVEQFTRLRAADRFWFENDPFFSPADLDLIRTTTLADVIRRNSAAAVQDDVFRVPAGHLEITAIAFERATSTVTLSWHSRGGEAFEIQASDDFGDNDPFQTIATTTGTAGLTTLHFTDPAAVASPRRAYRVVQP